jgi:hypothetical protein
MVSMILEKLKSAEYNIEYVCSNNFSVRFIKIIKTKPHLDIPLMYSGCDSAIYTMPPNYYQSRSYFPETVQSKCAETFLKESTFSESENSDSC